MEDIKTRILTVISSLGVLVFFIVSLISGLVIKIFKRNVVGSPVFRNPVIKMTADTATMSIEIAIITAITMFCTVSITFPTCSCLLMALCMCRDEYIYSGKKTIKNAVACDNAKKIPKPYSNPLTGNESISGNSISISE